MDKLDRIGLLGGSFDPIHLGHINMGLRALKEFGLNKVFYITAKNSPFKLGKNSLNAEQRNYLVEKALELYPSLEASRIELDRKEEVSYSYQTIQEFKNLYPQAQIFWLLGDDSFSRLNEWKNYQWINENVEFIVFKRQASNLLMPPNMKVSYIEDFDFSISSSDIKNAYLDIEESLPKNIIEDYLQAKM